MLPRRTIFRTTALRTSGRRDDYGKTWKKIVSGIAPNDFVHAVREDLERPGLLYAGTEHGFYVSFDDGDHWQPLSLNSARHASLRHCACAEMM